METTEEIIAEAECPNRGLPCFFRDGKKCGRTAGKCPHAHEVDTDKGESK